MTEEDIKAMLETVAGIRQDLDAMVLILAELRPLVEEALAAIAASNTMQSRVAVDEEGPTAEVAVAPSTGPYLAP